MHNSKAVYSLIQPSDKVLDVGGYYWPFERANSVIDLMPYEGHKNGAGLCGKQFSKETWHQQDVCDSTKKWPFKDKEFDFSVAGHILEDVRDPIFVINELTRVSKKGYIEIPSRYMEQVHELETSKITGFAHHRWLIDIHPEKQATIRLVFKNHNIHTDSRFHIQKKNHWPHINPNIGNFGFFWEGSIICEETVSTEDKFYKEFFTETVLKSASIPNLFELNEPTPIKIWNPFKNNGEARIIPFNDTIIK